MHDGEEELGAASESSVGSGGVTSRQDDGGDDIGAGDEANKTDEEEDVGPRRVLPYVRRTVGLWVSRRYI